MDAQSRDEKIKTLRFKDGAKVTSFQEGEIVTLTYKHNGYIINVIHKMNNNDQTDENKANKGGVFKNEQMISLGREIMARHISRNLASESSNYIFYTAL